MPTLPTPDSPTPAATTLDVTMIVRFGVRAIAAALIGGAQTALPQQLPPIRPLGAQLAISKDTLGGVTDVRQLSDGRLMFNDGAKRRLLLFDSMLTHATVIADTTSITSKAYPDTRFTGLLAYRGDTTLLIDPLIFVLLVVDPQGKIVRTISAPHPTDIGSLVSALGGAATFDAKGRLVYRLTGRRLQGGGFAADAPGLIASRAARNPGAPPSRATQDSIPIVAVDMTSHATDTVGFALSPRGDPGTQSTSPDGTTVQTLHVNPITQGDVVAHVADGSTAIIRAQDYHIDWINADGTHASTPKWRTIGYGSRTARRRRLSTRRRPATLIKPCSNECVSP